VAVSLLVFKTCRTSRRPSIHHRHQSLLPPYCCDPPNHCVQVGAVDSDGNPTTTKQGSRGMRGCDSIALVPEVFGIKPGNVKSDGGAWQISRLHSRLQTCRLEADRRFRDLRRRRETDRGLESRFRLIPSAEMHDESMTAAESQQAHEHLEAVKGKVESLTGQTPHSGNQLAVDAEKTGSGASM